MLIFGSRTLLKIPAGTCSLGCVVDSLGNILGASAFKWFGREKDFSLLYSGSAGFTASL
jgi:hypothetical protein